MGKLLDANFFIRFVSAFVMGSVFVFCVLNGGFFFSLMILLITSLAYFEWFGIILEKIKDQNESKFHKYLGFWGLIGSFLILPFSVSMLYLRFGDYNSEKNMILYIFFIVLILAVTDIGAYIFGRIIGGKKIWPKISPNKTIAGSVAAICLSIIAGILFKFVFKIGPNFLQMIWISLILSVFAQVGGLIMSFFKRHFGVKDSGRLIPGHGGFLDRIDSYFIALPFFVFLIIFKLFI